MMDHPNIAKVLDAGTTDGGRPFFVMELVKGMPITRYCDEHKLTPRQRLELFVPVCQAIQHAHQKGIIHRDLKPSNVLVALYDDRPVPKVIDFGVAKAAGQSLTDKTLMTGFGQIVGTPEYMSPEQATLNNLDIDTRSDVYSLGVLLYELLTGTTPLDRNSLGKAAVLEILRIVREVEAPRPSAKLSSIDTLPSVAANRGTEPAKLCRLMKGELDWLVMKALEKDRTRRYETANGLARDIQRYLADEVVEARPPSVGYQVRKFVRRHKGQVIAASLVLLALLGGIVGTTLGLFEARRQEQIARDETAEKEKARVAEAERVKERDAALDEANYQLDSSSFLLAVAAYDNRDVYTARLRLESIQAKHRGWEWYYLRRQCTGGIFTLHGHTNWIGSVAFSPDGKRIVTGSGDQTAKVWDAQTGTQQLELRGHTGGVYSVAFSPDGTRIVTGGEDRTARVWDARTGTFQRELTGHTSRVQSVAFSPDGKRIVTGSEDQTARVWDARTGTRQLELTGHTGTVWNVAFSPDGKRIVTGSWDGTAKVWDAQTGTLQLRLTGWVLSVAFSPDGTRIVTGSLDHAAKVWDAQTGTQQLELKGHKNGVYCVAFSPDGGRIVTGSHDFTARVWDARKGSPQLELKGHTGGVRSVAFSPDGTRIVTGSNDQTARVWDARTGTPQRELEGHKGWVLSVAFSPDGTRIVTGSWDDTAKVWDARTGTPQRELEGHTHAVLSVVFSPDGTRIVTGSWDDTAKVWDARTGTRQLELKGHTGGVYSVAFSPDGTRLVTGSHDLTARVWDARTGMPQLQLTGHTGLVYSVAFSPNGTRIVTGSVDQTASVWDARTGTRQLELKEHTQGVWSVAFSPDGTRIVTGSYDQTAKVWDARTGTRQLELKGHTGGVTSVAFSPDGTRIVTGSYDQTARVWDARTGSPLLELKGHAAWVTGVAFSPDGTRIVTGSWDQTAKVWDARTGTPPRELKGHTGSVDSVAFSPDGTRLVTRSQDGTAKVWDARTGWELKGEPIPPLIAPKEISPDGRFIAHRVGSLVELVPLQPDEEEVAYRRMHMQPNVWRYREGYEAALAAKDEFAAQFYLPFLPPPEQEIRKAQAAADREIAADRTADALVYLAKVSAANPEDTILFLKLAALQAWFGRDQELAATCRRGLAWAKNTTDPATADQVARACCVLPWTDKTQHEEVLALARKAVQLRKDSQDGPWFHRARRDLPWCQLTLGMSEYRSSHFAEADAALLAAANSVQNNYPGAYYVAGTSAFYRAMSLFQQGKKDEARRVATEATAKMKPLPKDEKNPLAGISISSGWWNDDLILWMAYKEAKALIGFDAEPTALRQRLWADPKVVSDLKASHRYDAACHPHQGLPPSRGRTPPSPTDEDLARVGPPHLRTYRDSTNLLRSHRPTHLKKTLRLVRNSVTPICTSIWSSRVSKRSGSSGATTAMTISRDFAQGPGPGSAGQQDRGRAGVLRTRGGLGLK
jgi:WD40 repeat protein